MRFMKEIISHKRLQIPEEVSLISAEPFCFANLNLVLLCIFRTLQRLAELNMLECMGALYFETGEGKSSCCGGLICWSVWVRYTKGHIHNCPCF